MISCRPQVVSTVLRISCTVRQASQTICPKPSHCRLSIQHQRQATEGDHTHHDQHCSQVSGIDTAECLSILSEKDTLQKTSTLFGRQKCSSEIHDRWKSSHISSNTFFENKHGFDPTILSRPHSFSLFLKPEVRCLLSQTARTPRYVYGQRRFFQKKMSRDYDDSLEFGKTKKHNDQTDRKHNMNVKDAFGAGLAIEKPMNKDEKTQLHRVSFLLAVATTLFGFLLYKKWVNSSAKDEDQDMKADSPGGLGAVGRFSFMEPGPVPIKPETVTVTFNDVKGVDEAKEELQDIVYFLQNNEDFQNIGAKLPKGVLLKGPPGTGKTMLAKAVAGEAGVPFFSVSGANFDEIFVGVGMKRVKALFAAAKKAAPCVIFIDEIDNVGRTRSSSSMNPYANQTITQLLSEMDGFNSREGVIVIGATNNAELIDKALLRPGRFDVEIQVMAPDKDGRVELFDLYLDKVKTSDSIDVNKLAALTFGMTGADIANLVNQAALHALREKKLEVSMEDLDFARDKVIMGPAWKNKKTDKETLWNTACHEAGHAIVAHYTKDALPVNKVTILPRGQSLGHTSFMPDKEQYGQTKSELLARIDVAMGGNVGEEMVFGVLKTTSGASADFRQATTIATNMVKLLGMSEKVGKVSFTKPRESDTITDLADTEINRLLKEGHERAKSIIQTHSVEHLRLAKALMQYEILDKHEMELVIKGKPLPKKPVYPNPNVLVT